VLYLFYFYYISWLIRPMCVWPRVSSLVC